MIGTVTSAKQLLLTVKVIGPLASIDFDCIVDTGFTDYVALPESAVARLGLSVAGTYLATLADGSNISVTVHRAYVIWHGLERPILVVASATPLIGMALLYGSEITIDVVDGGLLSIIPRDR